MNRFELSDDEKEIGRLRDALRPFADAAEFNTIEEDNGEAGFIEGITVGHYRTARRVLLTTEPQALEKARASAYAAEKHAAALREALVASRGGIADYRERELTEARKHQAATSIEPDIVLHNIDRALSTPAPPSRVEDRAKWVATINRLENAELSALAELDEERAQHAALAEAARALVEALPKCDECGKPATRAWKRGEGRWCDEHAPQQPTQWGVTTAPEYPRAAPLRALTALLSGAPSDYARRVEVMRARVDAAARAVTAIVDDGNLCECQSCTRVALFNVGEGEVSCRECLGSTLPRHARPLPIESALAEYRAAKHALDAWDGSK